MRSSRVALVALGLVFLLVRVPLMYRTFGGQDEDYYAVPGSTILDDGIPRIPYVPSRDSRGVFYKADEALLASPPLYFYFQAVVFLVFGPGYGPARLTSAFAGLAALWCVYLLGKRFYDSERVALGATGLYSLLVVARLLLSRHIRAPGHVVRDLRFGRGAVVRTVA